MNQEQPYRDTLVWKQLELRRHTAEFIRELAVLAVWAPQWIRLDLANWAHRRIHQCIQDQSDLARAWEAV